MKIIDLDQGSPSWLSWRKTVITATDCPAIRGTSPWSTAYIVWQRKLGLIEEQKSNEAMERGKRLEPILRERFIRKYCLSMTPIVVESSEYSFLGASLDGISDCGKYILEIKTGGFNVNLMAREGKIPPYYMDQIQQQLLVTGAERCFYFLGNENEDKDIVIEVYPDPEFAKAYLPVARAFWRCVAFNEPPELQPSDYKDMSEDPLWKRYADEYKSICEQLKQLEESKDQYRKRLLELCCDHNCSGEGVRVMKSVIRGRIAYDEVPEIKDVDLDRYRKSSTTLWKVFVA